MQGQSFYSERSCCRGCGHEELIEVLDLGNQALTGVFPKDQKYDVPSGPIILMMCGNKDECGLVQIKHTYSGDVMYGENYGYRSGLNASMVSHLRKKVQSITEKVTLASGDTVIDIGSNDATTLKFYDTPGLIRVGVDPSGTKFQDFYTDGIILLPDYFSEEVVSTALNGERAKVITSFSMFYDLEDPVSFAIDIANCLDASGRWFLEQSYLPTMLEANSFDTACHEHIEYYSLKSIQQILSKAGLVIIDVELNDVNGGSFSLEVAHRTASHQQNESAVNYLLKKEAEGNIDDPLSFYKFRQRIDAAGVQLKEFLLEAKIAGKRVYGLGASTKGNVLLQYYGIDAELLPMIAEVNSDKFGAYTPGTKIPIVSQDQALDERPDYLLVLPWHFREFFKSVEALSKFDIVYPLPEFKIDSAKLTDD